MTDWSLCSCSPLIILWKKSVALSLPLADSPMITWLNLELPTSQLDSDCLTGLHAFRQLRGAIETMFGKSLDHSVENLSMQLEVRNYLGDPKGFCKSIRNYHTSSPEITLASKSSISIKIRLASRPSKKTRGWITVLLLVLLRSLVQVCWRLAWFARQGEDKMKALRTDNTLPVEKSLRPRLFSSLFCRRTSLFSSSPSAARVWAASARPPSQRRQDCSSNLCCSKVGS